MYVHGLGTPVTAKSTLLYNQLHTLLCLYTSLYHITIYNCDYNCLKIITIT